MEENTKFLRYLIPLAFSLIVGIGFFSNCRPIVYGTVNFYFQNDLDQEIELMLYTKDNQIKEKVKPSYHINSTDRISLISFKMHDRDDEYTGDYFSQLVDSVKVTIKGQESFIAFWRRNGNHSFEEGYENLKDFYSTWETTFQHGDSNDSYVYVLEK